MKDLAIRPPVAQDMGQDSDRDFQASDESFISLSIRRKQNRNKCIRKVYFLLAAQQFISSVNVILFSLHQGIRVWVKGNWHLVLLVYLSALITLFAALICHVKISGKHLSNIMVLLSFTTIESILLPAPTIWFDSEIAASIACTLITCILLTFLKQGLISRHEALALQPHTAP